MEVFLKVTDFLIYKVSMSDTGDKSRSSLIKILDLSK